MAKETEMIRKITDPPAHAKPQRTGKRVQAVPKGGQITVVKEGRPGQRGETQGRAHSRPVKTMAKGAEIANPLADVKLQLQHTVKRVQAVPKDGQITVVKREDVPTVGQFGQPPKDAPRGPPRRPR